ncbi:MAG TPA: hypothetical protein VN442_14245 [Bryobacteraceae bacterium]|nr:hypothetical protein [Bryobacteraceae bacterium]
MLYLSQYPVQVNQDSAARAYLSIIKTRKQHEELMAGLERHKVSTLWLDDAGELKLTEIAKWTPPDQFIIKRKCRDHPPPWAPRKPTKTDPYQAAIERARAEDARRPI